MRLESIRIRDLVLCDTVYFLCPPLQRNPPPQCTLYLDSTEHPNGVLSIWLEILPITTKISCTMDSINHPFGVLPVRYEILSPTHEVPCTLESPGHPIDVLPIR